MGTKKSNRVNPSELHTLFTYDAATGKLYWKVKRKTAEVGQEAGWVSPQGYRDVRINSMNYRVHRVIWCMHTGVWPGMYMDHINGNKLDNRIENLREGSPRQNLQNLNVHRLGICTPGVRQVSPTRWDSRIHVHGKRIHLGHFTTKEAAAEAYRLACVVIDNLEKAKLLAAAFMSGPTLHAYPEEPNGFFNSDRS